MKSSGYDLDLAFHQLADTQLRINSQLARIKRLHDEGQPTEAAENLLGALQKSLDLFKAAVASMSAPEATNNSSK